MRAKRPTGQKKRAKFAGLLRGCYRDSPDNLGVVVGGTSLNRGFPDHHPFILSRVGLRTGENYPSHGAISSAASFDGAGDGQ